jgi:hypothetical protein
MWERPYDNAMHANPIFYIQFNSYNEESGYTFRFLLNVFHKQLCGRRGQFSLVAKDRTITGNQKGQESKLF